ncbi:Aldo/keto reductase [Pleurotus eryngii]|uniref:Aldo/keto reductase n=1 Tax=Pleurotus eryngii TaxID=5323 RepID=A0A9P6D4M7_PLEER|nr:Aldo/keto reductase [Pleurotus eryngii]
MSTYPTRRLGKNGPLVSAIGLGAMGIGAYYGKIDETAAHNALTYAVDRGITMWDTSDMYGESEAILGKWFVKTGRRADVFLATKWGGMDFSQTDPAKQHLANSKPAYIRERVKASLAALQTDYIDLYYQHRVDAEVPIEIVLETLRPYVESGTIRWLGLSECNVDTLKRARAVKGVGEKVVAVQMEFSPFELEIEKNGFAEAAEEVGVAVVCYSPLARGLVSGRFRSPDDFDQDDIRRWLPRFSAQNFPKNLEAVDKIKAIANKHNATPSQVTLAWILTSHDNFIPIPGTRNAERLAENSRGAELKLSPSDVKEIRDLLESADVGGGRYPDGVPLPTGECIPLSEWKGE